MFDVKCNHRQSRSRVLPELVLAAALVGSLASGQPTLAQSTQVETEVTQRPADLVNQLTQTAVQLGALTCAARIQQVTSFLGVTPETRASIRRPANPPDSNNLSLAMTTQTDGTTAIAMAEFYPSSAGCKASYNLTVNLPQSCDQLRSSGFASLSDANSLSENITVLGDATSLRVILMDAGEGCTAIKTETIE